MPLSPEHKFIWEKLKSAPKQSFGKIIEHDPEDTALEAPGIYVVWDTDDKPLYIGCALMSRPPNGSLKRMWGLKDRLDSHRRAQISGSSLALAAWFCKIAPSLTIEQHQSISDHQLNPSALTEKYIEGLWFSCLPVQEAGVVEAALYRDIKPPLNEYQEFVRKDRLARAKIRSGIAGHEMAQPIMVTLRDTAEED